MPHPQVLIVFNEPVLPLDHPDALSEHDIFDTVKDMSKLLEDAHFPVRRLAVSRDPGVLLRELRDHPPDVVFNLFEGLADNTLSEIGMAALLEWLEVPFTGSSSLAIALGRDKVRTKCLLQGAGLPTPGFLVIERGPCPRWQYPWPAIVKPACTDCSIGIEQHSVVTNQEQLRERVAACMERHGPPVLVEQYIDGREFHVSFVDEPGEMPTSPEVVAVPLAEVRFNHDPEKKRWPIYSYTAKWLENSDEYMASPLEAPVYLPPEQEQRVFRVCRDAYRVVGLRDYGRVDIRLSASGEPYILEVNPNPYLNSITLIRGLEAIGRSLQKMLVDSVWAALARGAKSSPPQARPMPPVGSA